jgi:hypothetical protein
MFYVNHSWTQGQVLAVPPPRIKDLSPRTKIFIFKLLVVESWSSPSGEPQEHRNEIFVEFLGRGAQKAFDELRSGAWVGVNGYIRSETSRGREYMKIRAYELHYGGLRVEAEHPHGDQRGESRDLPTNVRVRVGPVDAGPDGVHREPEHDPDVARQHPRADGREGPDGDPG